VLESVTVIEGVLVPVAVGVPEIAPEELMLRPAGSPVADQVYGVVPPLALIEAEYAAPVKPPGNDAVAIDKPAPTVMESALVVTLRWLGVLESVTVIEGVLVPAAVGVPEIAPAELILRPAGSPAAVQVYGAVPPPAAMAAE
jgi:hypothetical protein